MQFRGEPIRYEEQFDERGDTFDAIAALAPSAACLLSTRSGHYLWKVPGLASGVEQAEDPRQERDSHVPPRCVLPR